MKHKIHGELKQVWEPGKVDYVVIRENTEDAYTGETNSIRRRPRHADSHHAPRD